MSATKLSPPSVRWDLSVLFDSITDPRIEKSWSELAKRMDAFSKAYRGRVAELSAIELATAIAELESIAQTASKPVQFAQLLFACDALSAEIGAFMQGQIMKASELRVKLMFFELELQKVSAETINHLVNDPALASYRHFIATTRASSPFMLSEMEEVIFEETSNTGGRAWERFFDEVTAKHEYIYVAPGADEANILSQEEVLTLLRDPNREVRVAAADSFTAGLAQMEHTLTYIYNTLLLEKSISDRLRGHASPEEGRHISNELTKDIVDIVVDESVKQYPLVARYYRVKRKLLGLETLTHVDRYAPLFGAENEYSFDEAKTIVLSAFGEFSSTLEEKAREFFDKKWIDAEPRTGKTGGAFCSYLTPDTHPVVLMSYMNKDSHVGTLAHELGHGVHASLSRKQTYLNYQGTLPLAELASIFAEMLVFEKMIAGASPKDKLAMYADKIEGIFASVFRQISMFRFERRAHEARASEGELTADQFGDIWHDELQAMFGDSVELGEDHRRWWGYVSHFVSVPFYVYAYAFGELLTLALYEKAKQEGPSFATKYRWNDLSPSLSGSQLSYKP
ncbi:MAG: M3 family oligoendopeptidase [Armatimonadetes bacterium]|nr:M3 family oligoendopeptidase [Armatimonadota bacterium]